MRLLPIRERSSGDVRWARRVDGGFELLETGLAAFTTCEPDERDSLFGERLEAGWEPARMPVSKVVCIGLNYAAHAAEQGKALPAEPLMFIKPPTTVRVSGEPIELPAASELVHHEGELAVVIGRRAKRVSVESALEHVLGYTCANDVTARDIQRRENRYTRAKGYDSFAPMGPVVVTADEFCVPDSRIELRVNGEVRQSSRLDDFIFDVPTVVSFVSTVMTLEPGDVILTGTPAGVGPLLDGDVVEVEIDGIGVLSNPVERAS